MSDPGIDTPGHLPLSHPRALTADERFAIACVRVPPDIIRPLDLIPMKASDHGGGEAWFDEALIERNGRFVPDALSHTNPATARADEGIEER